MKQQEVPKQYLKTAALGIAALAASYMPANAQHVSLEAHKSSEQTVIRPKVGVNTPGGTSLFAFADFYENGSYIGKAKLSKPLTDRISAKIEYTALSFADNIAAPGIALDIVDTENAGFAAEYYPKSMDMKARPVDERSILGYTASLKPSDNISLRAFGQVNIANGQWSYGEFTANYHAREDLSLFYKQAHHNDGDLTPNLEHRIGVSYTF